jgi:hypothetical protein
MSLLGFSASAYAAEAVELQVSRIGDVELSCGALSQEALLMRDIITTTEDIQDDSEIKGHGITAAGAVGSFLIGTATGGVGLAAAGFLLNRVNEEKADEALSVQEIAQQRRALMVGIFNAKGCKGPVNHVMQDGTNRPDGQIIEIASVEPAGGEPHGAVRRGEYRAVATQQPDYND